MGCFFRTLCNIKIKPSLIDNVVYKCRFWEWRRYNMSVLTVPFSYLGQTADWRQGPKQICWDDRGLRWTHPRFNITNICLPVFNHVCGNSHWGLCLPYIFNNLFISPVISRKHSKIKALYIFRISYQQGERVKGCFLKVCE